LIYCGLPRRRDRVHDCAFDLIHQVIDVLGIRRVHAADVHVDVARRHTAAIRACYRCRPIRWELVRVLHQEQRRGRALLACFGDRELGSKAFLDQIEALFLEVDDVLLILQLSSRDHGRGVRWRHGLVDIQFLAGRCVCGELCIDVGRRLRAIRQRHVVLRDEQARLQSRVLLLQAVQLLTQRIPVHRGTTSAGRFDFRFDFVFLETDVFTRRFQR